MRKKKLLAVLTGLFLSCCVLPFCLAKESKIDEIHRYYISQAPIYDNVDVTEFVDRVGQKLVKANNLRQPYRFFVLDNPDINAFTPGYGYIYINRGLLTLLNSEAELAAVLAHEIAHNTERHTSRKKAGAILSNIAAYVAAIAVGNGNIYDVVQTSAAVRMQGFGREMELESDERGAEYLYKANYKPEAMLGVLSVLKNHERINDLRSIKDGGNATYHGVFATHPRKDKRLQEVVAKAGTLPPGEGYDGRDEMRRVLDSVIVGPSISGTKINGFTQFVNKSLGITLYYPEDWSKTVSGAKIIFKDAAKTLQLKLTVSKTADKTKSSQQLLSEAYPEGLTNVQIIKKDPAKDLGTTARYQQQRVAIITIGRNTYHFEGIARDNQLSDEEDNYFKIIIGSLRRAVPRDYPASTVKRIYYQRLEPGQTFADLAKDEVFGAFTEQELRLMNGYYPKGEPEPGTWIKLVRSEPVEAQSR